MYVKMIIISAVSMAIVPALKRTIGRLLTLTNSLVFPHETSDVDCSFFSEVLLTFGKDFSQNN